MPGSPSSSSVTRCGASSDQTELSVRIKMLDSKVLEKFYPSMRLDTALGVFPSTSARRDW